MTFNFECPPYGNDKEIVSFDYNNLTGESSIVLAEPHGLQLNARTPVAVSTAVYDNVSGIVTITTVDPINLDFNITNGVQLSGLGFTCNSVVTTTNVTNAVYDNVSGIVTVTTDLLNNAVVGSKVKLEDLNFECSSGGAPTQQLFPSGAEGFDFIVTAYWWH